MYFFIFLYVSYMTSASSILIKNSVCKPLTCRGDPIGECEETPNGPVCHCKDGFKGQTCGSVFNAGDDPCSRTPCNYTLVQQ
jgi:hypothetical protein